MIYSPRRAAGRGKVIVIRPRGLLLILIVSLCVSCAFGPAAGESPAEGAAASDRGHYEAAETNPEDASALACLGSAQYRAGEYEEASVSLTKAIALDPTLTPAHYNLGSAYLALGKPTSAIASYQEAIFLEPYSPTGHYSLGTAYLMNDQYDFAVGELSVAVELDPNRAAAHHNLGLALERGGSLSEAVAAYREAVALAPDEGAFRISLAKGLSAAGESEQALRHLSLLRVGESQSPDVYLYLGLLQYQRGEHEKVKNWRN